MYFDFEDYRPDISPVGSAMSWREGVLISIVLHLLATLFLVLSPDWLPETARDVPVEQIAREDPPRFVFVEPRIEAPALTPPRRPEPSDMDRTARAPDRAPVPENDLPMSRGNSPERVEAVPEERAADRDDGDATLELLRHAACAFRAAARVRRVRPSDARRRDAHARRGAA